MKFCGTKTNSSHSAKKSQKKDLRGNLILLIIFVGIVATFINFRIIVANTVSSFASFVEASNPPANIDVNVTIVPVQPESNGVEVRVPDFVEGYFVEPLVSYVEDFSFGYTNAQVNVRQSPSTDSKILTTYPINTEVSFHNFNDNWYEISFGDSVAYIFKSYISPGQLTYESHTLTSKGFKSFMSYTAITAKSSYQYKIQHQYAYTGEYGIRQVDGRFCVALGSAVHARMGTYIDLVLDNGTIIPCILSDQKDDRHTLSDNLTTASNGCVSEFLIDTDVFDSTARLMGDVSFVNSAWASPVVEIRVYPQGIWN